MQRICITVFVVFLCIAGASAQSSNKLVAASAARGKTVYLQRCMVCHQADGGGVPKLNAPLDGSSSVNSSNIAKLVKYIVKGFNDRVEIDGEFYENAMPAAADLTDQQIADVLTFIRNSWTNKAGPVTTLQVKQTRSKLK
ncbi:MAG: cytochrome c [Bacteroidetes bacterium]|jgi:mono/diheme cytochrome c family protein|nr:cytochrome c [Bacteroidota bacterium]